MNTDERKTSHNSTYKKLAVRWLNEVQFFSHTFVQTDSFELRNRQLFIAAKRCATCRKANAQIGTFGFCRPTSQTQKTKRAYFFALARTDQQ